MSRDKFSWRDWFGFRRYPDFTKARWLGGLIGVVLICLVGFIVVAVGIQFTSAITGIDTFADAPENHEAIRNIGLVLAAIIGVPFVIWRSVVAQKQADIAEQSHITEQINTAVAGLGAEKTAYNDAGNPKMVPNIEVRLGAIYALERIAQDSPRDHIQIMEILTAYIRENAPASSVESLSEPISDSINDLTAKTDIQAAIQVIGRRSEAQIKVERSDKRYGHKGFIIDLRSTVLRALDLSNKNFEYAMLQGARMEKANLSNSLFDHANLEGSILNFAVLENTSMRHIVLKKSIVRYVGEWSGNLQNSNFEMAHLENVCFENAAMNEIRLENLYAKEVYFENCKLVAAKLSRSKFENVSFNQSNLENAYFGHSRLTAVNFLGTSTNLNGVSFNNTRLKFVDFSDTNLSQEQIERIRSGADVLLPKGLSKPSHWQEAKTSD